MSLDTITSPTSTEKQQLWCIRKWVQRVRQRIMDKRVLGAEDLYTMEAIPPESLVAVYDTTHKTKYLFHTNTISRSILYGLTYSAYGIASPKMPTNPYTNIPWTIGQLIAIVGQIAHNLNRNHCMLPNYIYLFRKEMYDISQFFLANRTKLHVDAAYAFFKKEDDAYRDLIYSEIVEDLYAEHRNLLVSGWRIVRSIVLTQRLPLRLKARWDNLVLSSWLLQNHHMTLLEEDIGVVFLSVHMDTMTWWRAQTLSPPRVTQPTPNTSPITAQMPTATSPITAQMETATSPITAQMPQLRPATPPAPPSPTIHMSPPYILSNTVLPILAAPRAAPRSQQLMPPAPPPIPQLGRMTLPSSPMVAPSNLSSPISLLTDDEDILDITMAQMRIRPR